MHLPAILAECTPGSPLRALIQMPLSSDKATKPELFAAHEDFIKAFSLKVFPSSFGSNKPSSLLVKISNLNGHNIFFIFHWYYKGSRKCMSSAGTVIGGKFRASADMDSLRKPYK